MALSDLSSSQLRRLVKLVRLKETLQAKLATANRQIDELEGGDAVSRRTSPKGKRRKRRGAMRDSLLELLKTAGKDGLSVNELAERLKAKPASVSVWFYTIGKKIKGLKKIGRGRYAYKG